MSTKKSKLNINSEKNLSQDEPTGNTETRLAIPAYQNYRWAFTLKREYICKLTGKSEPIEPEFLCSILKQHCKEFYFQLEKAESGYVHFQGCFSLNVKHRLMETKNLLGFKKVHLEPVKNWHASINYSTKEATRLEGPWNHFSTFVYVIKHLNFWQLAVLDMLKNQQPDPRKIHWIWDQVGNKGKSTFSKFVAINYGATILNNGSFSDLAFSIPSCPKIVIFDFPRTIEGRVNYSAIEAVKNGLIFSGKYESKTKIFNPPHIIVFSNFPPDRGSMSEDRWDIINLDD